MRPQGEIGQRLLVVLCVVGLVAIAGGVTGAFTANASTQHDSADLSVEMSGGSVSPGETVTVEVTLENTGADTSPAPVFNLTALPDGWEVTSWSAPDATYQDDSNEWLWMELEAGNTHSLAIDIQAPEDASDITVSGIGTDGASNTASDSTEISLSTTDSGGGDSDTGSDGGGGSSQSDTTTSTPTATTTPMETATSTPTTSPTSVPESTPSQTQPDSTPTEPANVTSSPSAVSPSETPAPTDSGVELWVIFGAVLLLTGGVAVVLLLR
jgi:hypothetical protein